MRILRKVQQYELMHEPLQNLYRVASGNKLSLWFGSDVKGDLMKLPIYKFTKECDNLINNSI